MRDIKLDGPAPLVKSKRPVCICGCKRPLDPNWRYVWKDTSLSFAYARRVEGYGLYGENTFRTQACAVRYARLSSHPIKVQRTKRYGGRES